MVLNGKTWKIHHGDCIEHMASLPEASFDMSVFSPPFPTLYAYSAEDADIGNSEDLGGDAKIHLSCFYRQLVRVMKPGRVVVVHVAQIPRMKRIDRRGGLFDFRGLNIRLGERAGMIFDYDWMIRKNPQSQAIRTRSRELQFSGLENDRARTRGTLCDYLLKFMIPGENQVPITDRLIESDDSGDISVSQKHSPQVTRNEWIDWAEGCWWDIKETDTLNVKGTKGDGDTKHICPLQLGVIKRLVKLYSNPGEIVFSPFAGIGSEIYTAVKLGRRSYGCELKREYYETAVKNMRAAESYKADQDADLFAEVEPA